MDGRGSIKELFPTGKQLEPLVAPLADGKVAVGQDDLTVVLNEEGTCTQKCALNWTDIPVAMGMIQTCSTFFPLHFSGNIFCSLFLVKLYTFPPIIPRKYRQSGLNVFGQLHIVYIFCLYTPPQWN